MLEQFLNRTQTLPCLWSKLVLKMVPSSANITRIRLDFKKISMLLVKRISLRNRHNLTMPFQIVNVIKGALQILSVPPADTYIPTLVGDGWTPPISADGVSTLVFHGSNPNQIREKNLKASAVTRTVGGMATHWTCACRMYRLHLESRLKLIPFDVAIPHEEEIVHNPIPKPERDVLFPRAQSLLNVHNDQYEFSMRHTTVKDTLLSLLPAARNVQSLPLAVERRSENPEYVTWTGANTVLGDISSYGDRFKLLSETRFTRLVLDPNDKTKILGAELRDLKNDADLLALGRVRPFLEHLLPLDSFFMVGRPISLPPVLWPPLKFLQTVISHRNLLVVISVNSLFLSPR